MVFNQKYETFLNNVSDDISSDRIFTDSLHTLAYGTDASFYRLIPKIVIKAINEHEVIQILKYANKENLSVTFRAAGTSLSGQAISDSILVICAFGWRDIQILNEGKLIKLAPGVVGAQANNALRFYGKKIGPDPASIHAAAIGGIVANNASGMCCGIEENSYKTLEDIRIIFNDGTILDTSDEKSINDFKNNKKDLIEEIEKLVSLIKNNQTLYEKIVKKYSIKNTTGYSINALIDFDNPIDIIAHLMVGSEGSLGFISSVTFNTVSVPKAKASSLILFDNIHEACKFVANLKQHKGLVDAAELMDRASLRSVEDKDGVDPTYKELDGNVASILVECGTSDKEDLDRKIYHVELLAKQFKLTREVKFFDDEKECEKLWAIRKGTFPTVGAMRESGTTTIIEDIAFSVDDLADGVVAVQELFKKYGYFEGIIFGHALEGNIHFVFNQDFENKKEVKRYEAFMDDICELVAIKYKGSLKAEHGTGRNMAPFVEMEWGNDAYVLMKQIKSIFDPKNLLNPGVIINNDPKAHLKDLKFMSAFNPIADKCIECGFCEPICPSKDLTITPRQRIAVKREIQRKKNYGEDYKELEKLYLYDGEKTCAVDGLCATSCPVGINTGALTKDIREKSRSGLAKSIASKIAKNYGMTLGGVKIGFSVLNRFEKIIKPSGFRTLRQVIPQFPYWLDSMPRVAKYHKTKRDKYSKKVVYFSSCINRTFGNDKRSDDTRDLNEVVESLLYKAKFDLVYISKDKNLCCGVPFESKGFKKEADEKLEELLEALVIASNFGEYPILVDNSPCNYRIVQNLKQKDLDIYEPIAFALKFLVHNLDIKQSDEVISIHTTCSSKKLGLDKNFKELANLLSSDVIIPGNINCCGFAGDRGFNFPELNRSALFTLKPQLKEKNVCKGYSTSKTCEMGLSHNSGVQYSSILYLLDQQSYAKDSTSISSSS
jgi:D-lactate dehydrogenase